MGVSVGTVDVDFRAQTTKFNQNLERIDKKLGRFGKEAERMKGKVTKLGGAVLGVAGAAGFGALIKSTLNAADSIAKSARAAGLANDTFQEYVHAADLAGISQDGFSKAAGTFNKRLGELRNGTGALVGFLKKYDEGMIDVLASTSSTDEALDIFLGQIAGVEDSSEQAAIAAAGFSKSLGIGMVELVRGGTDALSDAREEAQALGLVLSDTALRDAERANDAMSKLTKSVTKLTQNLILKLAPGIADVADLLTEYLPKGIEAIEQGFLFLFTTFDQTVTNLGLVGDAFNDFVDVSGAAVDAVVAVVETKIGEAVDLFEDMRTKAVQSVKDMVNDVETWISTKLGGVMGKVGEYTEAASDSFFKLWDDVVGHSYIPDMVEGVADWILKLDGGMVKPVDEYTEATSGFFENMRDSIVGILSDVLTGAKSFGDSLKGVASGILDGFVNNLVGDGVGAVVDSIFGKGSATVGSVIKGAIQKTLGIGSGAGSTSAVLSSGALGAGTAGSQASGAALAASGAWSPGVGFAGAWNPGVGAATGATTATTAGSVAGATTTTGTGAGVAGIGTAVAAFALPIIAASISSSNKDKRQNLGRSRIQNDELVGGFSGASGDFLGQNATRAALGDVEAYIALTESAKSSTKALSSVLTQSGADIDQTFSNGGEMVIQFGGDIDAAKEAFQNFTPEVATMFETHAQGAREALIAQDGLRGNVDQLKDSQDVLAASWVESMGIVKMDLAGLAEQAAISFTNATGSAADFETAFKDGMFSATEAANLGFSGWEGGTVTGFIRAQGAAGDFSRFLGGVGNDFRELSGDGDREFSSIASAAKTAGTDVSEAFSTAAISASGAFGNLERDAGIALGAIVSGANSARQSVASIGGADHRIGAGLPGFANGGSFTVRGSGGTDSQIVPIRATPGERVTVETPRQQSRGGGDMTTVVRRLDAMISSSQKLANIEQQKLNRIRVSGMGGK